MSGDLLRFDGRVAVISGAGRGLGRAYALLLAARGARVVVNDAGPTMFGEGSDAGPAHEVVEAIRAAGGEAIASAESVATRAGATAVVEAALDRYGRVDILIHNAGITRRGAFRDLDPDDYQAVVDVHLTGAFHLCKAAFPRMCDAGRGSIVLTSSIAGLYGERNVAPYCVAKAGVIGLSHALAIEGAPHGVRSNVILPVAITRLAEGRDTSSFPPMPPEQVAATVAWLAHDSCPLSGEMLIAAAGRVASAFVAESRGAYQQSWSPEDVAARQAEILDRQDGPSFPVLPGGFADHLRYAFDMAGATSAPAAPVPTRNPA